jgi:hypothetical protein
MAEMGKWQDLEGAISLVPLRDTAAAERRLSQNCCISIEIDVFKAQERLLSEKQIYGVV